MHGFRGGGGFVEHAGVGDGECSQVGDHGLEVEESFKTALGDFGLVWGVGGVPAGVLEDVALDDVRGDGVVIADAEEGFMDFVFLSDFAEGGESLGFGESFGEVEWGVEADVRGDGLVDEFVEGFDTDELEHGGDVIWCWSDVAAGKGVEEVEG